MRTLPRPKERSTRAIVTVYDIPRQPSVIHDLDVDSAGNVWYGNTGWNYLGKLDPKTAMFSEYSAPTFASPSSVEGLMDVQVDAEDHVWAVVQGPKFARFNTRTLTWTSFDPPPGSSPGPFVAPFRISTAPPYYARPDRNGDVWTSSNGSDRLLRLDPETGGILEYLMPVYYDARKVVTDPTADRITVWLPNKNMSQLIKVEALD